MKVTKSKYRIIKEALARWESDEVIDPSTKERLSQNLEVIPFDWQRLARYSFIFAIGCIVIAVIATLADDWIVELIRSLVDSPDGYKSLFFALLAAMLFFLGYRRKSHYPHQRLLNEALYLLGAIATATSLGYLAVIFSNNDIYYPILVLIATLVYGYLGIKLKSDLIWAFALCCAVTWMIVETGYWSGWEDRLLGMNYTLRLAIFSFLMVTLSFSMLNKRPFSEFVEITQSTGMLVLFVSLWILSISGNYTSWDTWNEVRQYELWGWGLLMATCSVGAIFYGIKKDIPIIRDFGVGFLLLNLITRYVEYGYPNLHKAVFFGILGLIFWLIGSNAEKLMLRGNGRED
ncbi:MAG: hypothetical protein RIC80_18475 [Cyclobacteriaceae bacterium]